jgi:DNA-binding NarL/FixJ family response regulator
LPCYVIFCRPRQHIAGGVIFYRSETKPIMGRYEKELQDCGKHTTKLTAAEEEILRFTCEYLTAREIAAKVGLEARSVRDFSKKIKQKTGTKSISGMAVYAIKHLICLLKQLGKA